MPELNDDLAYLLGVYMGDGNVQIMQIKNRGWVRHFRLSVIDVDFVDETEKRLRNLGCKLISRSSKERTNNAFKKKKTSELFDIHCRERWLCEFLVDSTNWKKKIPDALSNSSDSCKKAFLAGLMDSDGWVQLGKTESKRPQIQVGFCSTSDWVDGIASMFQSLGVVLGKKRTEMPETRHGTIKSKMPIHRFYLQTDSFIKAGCYFTIGRKQDRLRDYNAVSVELEKRKERFEEYRIFRKENPQMSYRKIQEISGFNRETARLWDMKIEEGEPLYKKRG